MTEPNNNYTYARQSIFERFAAHIHGSLEAFMVVIGETHTVNATSDAFHKASEALGWGPACCVSCDLPQPLSKQEFYEIVEGLDPLLVVLADTQACHLAESAYSSPVPKEKRFRLFGRDACAFTELEAHLRSETGKQMVWALLRAK